MGEDDVGAITIRVDLPKRKILVRELPHSQIYSHEIVVETPDGVFPVERVKSLRYAVDLLQNLIPSESI